MGLSYSDVLEAWRERNALKVVGGMGGWVRRAEGSLCHEAAFLLSPRLGTAPTSGPASTTTLGQRQWIR